jgi:NTP pyrophosphatase (non-canonical NTP hydrolase)
VKISDYEKLAVSTNEDNEDENLNLARLALGVSDEAGEVCGKVKKLFRGDYELTEEKKLEIADEIGDVLWYCAVLSHTIGVGLEAVCVRNLDKLASRQLRGKIQGDGDNR